MALFERRESHRTEDYISSSDAATRALSVTAVENDFVEGVYEKLAVVYDWTFGPTLHPGRLQAIQRMGIQPGESILEVGVGTGINLALYPRDCAVTGSTSRRRCSRRPRSGWRRRECGTSGCSRWTPPSLKFADDSFDIVYAPYLISVVPDPVRVAAEMRRVCRPGGRIIFLNHFRSPNPLLSGIERLISPFTIHIGFKADLDLPAFLAQAGLHPVSIEKVNMPRIWSLVTCVKG